MAVSKEKGKTRLDFANAMNEMMLTEPKKPVMAEEVKQILTDEQAVSETADVITELPEEPVKPPVRKEKKKSVKTASLHINTDLEEKLLSSKKNRGVQKSVYFDAEVYQYIEELAVKYQVKFSYVLNELLRSVIE